MVEGTLVTAMDFRKDLKRKHEVYTYRKGDAWYVSRSGPTYSNVYRVTEYDAEGITWLIEHERAEYSSKPS